MSVSRRAYTDRRFGLIEKELIDIFRLKSIPDWMFQDVNGKHNNE